MRTMMLSIALALFLVPVPAFPWAHTTSERSYVDSNDPTYFSVVFRTALRCNEAARRLSPHGLYVTCPNGEREPGRSGTEPRSVYKAAYYGREPETEVGARGAKIKGVLVVGPERRHRVP